MKKIGILVSLTVIWGCSSHEMNDIPEEIQGLENLTVFPAKKEVPHQIDLEREQSFGDTEETLFGNLGDITVDERGRVFIADTQKMLIYVFEYDGRLIAELGREGQGPGEFGSIKSLHISNDRLYAFDPNRFMVHVFSLDTLTGNKTVILAENREEFQELSRAFPLINELFIRHDDTYIAKFISEKVEELVAWKNYEVKGLLYPLNNSGKISAGRILEFLYEMRTLTTFRDGLGGIVSVKPFFGKVLTVLSRDNSIYQAKPNHFMIKIHSPEGAYQRAFFYPHEKIPLTHESAVEAGVVDYFIENMSSIDLPQFWPVLTEMIIDHDDRLWVAATVEDMNVMEWWVLENTGELITKFEWPRDEPIEAVQNDYLYTRQTDEETGLEQIVRYRYEWSAKGI
ncbi:MAG: 6-bladed beta-propeller [Cyclonatronaceae bacterium]